MTLLIWKATILPLDPPPPSFTLPALPSKTEKDQTPTRRSLAVCSTLAPLSFWTSPPHLRFPSSPKTKEPLSKHKSMNPTKCAVSHP
jgi:hypothetical protein